MADDSIAWTSFRTLEPNPYPYTPMTQSILERGIETSSLVAAVRQDAPLTTFHRGHLYFNAVELRRLLRLFCDVPQDVLEQYFRDDAGIDFDRISIAPSLAGVALLARMSTVSSRILFDGLTVKRRLPDQPSVENRSNSELLTLTDTHQEFLTRMVGAHAVFSGLAESYAVGIERMVPGGPSRQRVQALVSSWTNSKTAEMARRAASIETDEERDAFLNVFGHRCPREMEIAVPRWRDDPSTLRDASTKMAMPSSRSWRDDPSTLREGPPRTRSPSNDESMGKLTTVLARFALYPGSVLERLRENPKNEWLKSYAYLRDLLLEVGRRATKSGHLATPEDVFYVSLGTANRLLDDPPSRSHTRSDVSRAKNRYEENRAYSPPLFVTADFQPVEQQSTGNASGTMRGLGVSRGVISGRAVTARSPEAVDLSHGRGPRILVTEFTDAGWTPLFFQIDGLVMERGSLLSHGSIVAREAGIPAVVNVEGALERIKSGDLIELNADDGSVRVSNT